MSSEETKTLSENEIFSAIELNDPVRLRTALIDQKTVNILDENLMTPLQHAAYKGNKELVQILIDNGADVNLCEHQHNYTALHFAALSGNLDTCQLLLLSGAKPQITNTVNRTAAQMAAFVGNHNCVTLINNFIPINEIKYFTEKHGQETKAQLPKFLTESLHKFLLQINIHPIKVALNLQNFLGLSEHLNEIKKVLELLSEKEMKAKNNEVLSFKFHYLSYIINEIIKLKQLSNNQSLTNTSTTTTTTTTTYSNENVANAVATKKFSDLIELFARKILKINNKNGTTLDNMENLLKDCIREFPYRDCTLFKQMITNLTSINDPPSALIVIITAINGQRGFIDTITKCYTCGEDNPLKKCSKCKSVQYCDRNCQRLHWHWHKKYCTRLGQNNSEISTSNNSKPSPEEIQNDLQQMLIK